VQQVDSPAILWTPRSTPDCCGSTPAQPASANTPRTFRLPVEGLLFVGFRRTEVSRNGLHGGSVVEVVDGVEIDDEVDVDVETGADADVEVDGAVVVDVDVGTGVVGGARVDDVEVVELEVVDAAVEEVDEVEVVEVSVADVDVLDVEVEVVEADVEEVVEVEVVDDVEVEVVDVEVEVVDVVELDVVDVAVEEVVEVDVVDVELDEVGGDVEVVELDVVDAEVEEVVAVDVVVVGTVLPPWTSPTLISSATNVPRMAALKRFSVAGFPSAQSWATTAVVVFVAPAASRGGRKAHVVVASGAGPAAGWPEKASVSWEPPAMLTASCLPSTSTRRSCGDPPMLIRELGRTSKESTTSSVLGAAAITWLPLFVVTLQKT
jgi:hypothetical protein